MGRGDPTSPPALDGLQMQPTSYVDLQGAASETNQERLSIEQKSRVSV